MANENAIKSALRRSLHFDNITFKTKNSCGIGFIKNSYYKFFLYNETTFLEIEIMGGTILSARLSDVSKKVEEEKLEIKLKLDTIEDNLYYLAIDKEFIPKSLDVEYSFDTFNFNTEKELDFLNNYISIKAGESKYYGTLISDASEIASTVKIEKLDLGSNNSTLTVSNIKIGNWNISSQSEGTALNITYK